MTETDKDLNRALAAKQEPESVDIQLLKALGYTASDGCMGWSIDPPSGFGFDVPRVRYVDTEQEGWRKLDGCFSSNAANVFAVRGSLLAQMEAREWTLETLHRNNWSSFIVTGWRAEFFRCDPPHGVVKAEGETPMQAIAKAALAALKTEEVTQ